jgi:hypothetical protein
MTATQTKSTPTIDQAFEQVKDASEQWFAAARKAGNLYVDNYEKAVTRAIDLELKVASLTQQEWVKSLTEVQTDFARELTESYVTTARSILK